MAPWSSQRKKSRGRRREGTNEVNNGDLEKSTDRPAPRWGMGILNDKQTDEVPGSVLLLSKPSDHNAPLGLRNTPARTSASSLPSPFRRPSILKEKKRTKDGKIILEPQLEDSLNDPLNWPSWRRDCALISLGLYCMIGGGMTPILAAGFNNVAQTFHVSVARVSLTVGLYMMGMGIGSVFASPTAILYGKRPVYLTASIVFILASVWCALSPNYASLVIARIVQGMSVSPVECLPSATIAEIYFLHERAYRLGVYTLLLLGGKNLVPLVSAAVIGRLGWRWVFWIVAMIVGFCGCLLFLFVPETFWDRAPRPPKPSQHRWPSHISLPKLFTPGRSREHKDEPHAPHAPVDGTEEKSVHEPVIPQAISGSLAERRQKKNQHHVEFAAPAELPKSESSVQSDAPSAPTVDSETSFFSAKAAEGPRFPFKLALPQTSLPVEKDEKDDDSISIEFESPIRRQSERDDRFLVQALRRDSAPLQNGRLLNPGAPPTPELRNLNSPWYVEKAASDVDYFSMGGPQTIENVTEPSTKVQATSEAQDVPEKRPEKRESHLRLSLQFPKKPKKASVSSATSSSRQSRVIEATPVPASDPSKPPSEPRLSRESSSAEHEEAISSIYSQNYTDRYRRLPPKSFKETLTPYSGRLSKTSWLRAAIRPFILYAYPSILWSTLLYSLSVGWLIVLSESVSVIYRNPHTYNFTALQTGLIYLSPFIGGILGTVVAGRISDLIVRWMARRNDGVYEPEFRLVMAVPIAVATAIGLMGFGWSAQERDRWIVPTLFFGAISFGCTLGSTTAITFAVDSYRQYAGEALVTLNFSKNIFHGLVFSLFFTSWLEDSGPKKVFLAVGGIQLACLMLTIPMYIYGKRARMWTVRQNLMERF